MERNEAGVIHLYGRSPCSDKGRHLSFSDTAWSCVRQLEKQAAVNQPAAACLEASYWPASRCQMLAARLQAYLTIHNGQEIRIKSPFEFHPSGRATWSGENGGMVNTPYRLQRAVVLRWISFLTTCGGLDIHESDSSRV